MGETGPIADWIVALSTVAALLVAAWQLRANARGFGQTHAREAWMEYLRLGLANPDLGEEKLAILEHKMKNITELVSGDSIASQRYLWFLSVMLEACESLLTYFPTRAWKRTIEQNLLLHKEAIGATWDEERHYYSPALQRVVGDVLSRKG